MSMIVSINTDCFDTYSDVYIDYQNFVDLRGWVARSSTSISISSITASASCNGANQFTVQRTGTATDGFADYHIEPDIDQNWSAYDEISFDICGGSVPYIVYIRDTDSGYTSLGKSTSGGSNSFTLPTNVNRKDRIDDIILRVLNQDLPGNTPITYRIEVVRVYPFLQLSHLHTVVA